MNANGPANKLISLLDQQKDKDSWTNRNLLDAIKAALEVEGVPFHHRAFFIHGFWLGIVAVVVVFGLATHGTLIYDLLVRK